MENKVCISCKESKLLCHFNKNKNSSDGLHCYCKECIKLRSKKYREDNLEKLKEKDKERYIINKKAVLDRNKKYRTKNSDKLYEKAKEWKSNNIELVSNYQKEYRKNNAIKISEYKKEYKKNNKHIIAWRQVLSNSLRQMGKVKENKTIELLGYSASELKQHLEKLFTEAMSWDNHGEWHIDHVKPIISFDKDTHPSVVNSLSNLQPLWATTREINGIIYEGNLNKPKY